MQKGVCAAYARRGIAQGLLIGPVCLTAGIGLAVLTGVFSGPPLKVMEQFGKNFVYISVILFLILGGGYLLFSGVRGLIRTDRTDICRYIRLELASNAAGLTGKELLALVDRDLAAAWTFSSGTIFIGREWLFVRNAWGKPIIRLEHIQQVLHHQTPKGNVTLKFTDHSGTGPVTRELTALEAGRIEAHLQHRVVYRKNFT